HQGDVAVVDGVDAGGPREERGRGHGAHGQADGVAEEDGATVGDGAEGGEAQIDLGGVVGDCEDRDAVGRVGGAQVHVTDAHPDRARQSSEAGDHDPEAVCGDGPGGCLADVPYSAQGDRRGAGVDGVIDCQADIGGQVDVAVAAGDALRRPDGADRQE